MRSRWHQLLADRRFQKWAAGIPGLRAIARREAQDLFDLTAGFAYTQILLAYVELGLLDRLSQAPSTAAELAAAAAIEAPRMERLLAAGQSLGMVRRRADGCYVLGRKGAILAGNPGIVDMIRHHRLLYSDLADPVALLREPTMQTELSRYWTYVRTESPDALAPQTVAEYSRLMASTQAMIADEIVAAYPFGRHRCLLDVGGGTGVLACAVALRHPVLAVRLFDLPAVSSLARARFEAAGLSARCEAYGGSFYHDALPRGADVACLVRVLFDHDDEHALTILRAVRTALPDGAPLIIAEPLASLEQPSRSSDGYFWLYLTAMGSGKTRTLPVFARLLEQAGFAPPRLVRPRRRPLLTDLLVARAVPART